MSYIEIKAIKTVAAVQRGVINTALRSLALRGKLTERRLRLQKDYSYELTKLARIANEKAATIYYRAVDTYEDKQLQLRAASNTILNLKDDLNKITE